MRGSNWFTLAPPDQTFSLAIGGHAGDGGRPRGAGGNQAGGAFTGTAFEDAAAPPTFTGGSL
eukprot:16442183-Heterocapsa_arctica.AAC.1